MKCQLPWFLPVWKADDASPGCRQKCNRSCPLYSHQTWPEPCGDQLVKQFGTFHAADWSRWYTAVQRRRALWPGCAIPSGSLLSARARGPTEPVSRPRGCRVCARSTWLPHCNAHGAITLSRQSDRSCSSRTPALRSIHSPLKWRRHLLIETDRKKKETERERFGVVTNLVYIQSNQQCRTAYDPLNRVSHFAYAFPCPDCYVEGVPLCSPAKWCYFDPSVCRLVVSAPRQAPAMMMMSCRCLLSPLMLLPLLLIKVRVCCI